MILYVSDEIKECIIQIVDYQNRLEVYNSLREILQVLSIIIYSVLYKFIDSPIYIHIAVTVACMWDVYTKYILFACHTQSGKFIFAV